MIRLEGVFKSYGSIRVLENFNLIAETGQSTCVIGRSGCGKSTLLKVAALITKPDRGNVMINGIRVNELENGKFEEERREKIAYSFQEPLLIPYMTAVENLTEVLGVRKERAVEVLSQLGLRDRLNHKPAKLSVGEKKRVDVARAVLRGLPVLVVDEPLSNLDPTAGLKVMGLLKECAKKGGTLIYSSVELTDAKYADKSLTM